MPFAKNDKKTIEAGRRGGKTGVKQFAVINKDKLREISSKAGKASGVSRRTRKQRADKIVDRVMNDYMEE